MRTETVSKAENFVSFPVSASYCSITSFSHAVTHPFLMLSHILSAPSPAVHCFSPLSPFPAVRLPQQGRTAAAVWLNFKTKNGYISASVSSMCVFLSFHTGIIFPALPIPSSLLRFPVFSPLHSRRPAYVPVPVWKPHHPEQ